MGGVKSIPGPSGWSSTLDPLLLWNNRWKLVVAEAKFRSTVRPQDKVSSVCKHHWKRSTHVPCSLAMSIGPEPHMCSRGVDVVMVFSRSGESIRMLK